MNFLITLLLAASIVVTVIPQNVATATPQGTGASCQSIALLKPRMTIEQIKKTIGNAPIKALDDYPTWYSVQIGKGDSFSGPIARVQISKLPAYRDQAVGSIVYGCGVKNAGWFL